MRWLAYAVVLFVVIPPRLLAQSRIPDSERSALIALFNSTHGEDWIDSEDWLSPKTGQPADAGTECKWDGVECDDAGRHVVALRLRNWHLNGSLPSAIADLRELQTLDLSSNSLQGEIPKSLFTLVHLEKLDLSWNYFSGPLPSVRKALPQLTELNLSNNAFSGRVKDIARLHNLVSLDLSNNRFKGGLPRSLKRLRNLEQLSLAGNALSHAIPSAIGNLKSLTFLSLAHNRFVGMIPARMGQLHQLQTLDLSYNELSGMVPTSFSRLESLWTLHASHNALEGTFPAFICQDSLRDLDLSVNQLLGRLPADLTRCGTLTALNLSKNRMQGELASGLFTAMAALQNLDLSGNHFSGPLPSSLNDASLLNLNLSDNNITDDVSRVDWPQLERLRMDRNHLSGPMSEHLFSESLKELTLSGNELSGHMPNLCQLTALRVLDLSNNRLTGSLCDELENLEDLSVINLSHNRLVGAVPASLFNMRNLTSLSLSDNSFTGGLPLDVSGRALQVFDISSNQVSGGLPSWIERLPLLRSVNIRRNAFKSGLVHLARAKNLVNVDFRENDWSEAPPQSLVSLQATSSSAVPIVLVDPNILVPEEKVPPPPPREEPPPVKLLARLPAGTESLLIGNVKGDVRGSLDGATVVAESGTQKRTATTDSEGRYRMPLPVGDYRVTINSSGYTEKVYEHVRIEPETSQALDVNLDIKSVMTSTISMPVSGGTPEDHRGPWWNSWITKSGAMEDSTETVLTPNENYSFYLELSGISKQNQENGERAVILGASIRDKLIEKVRKGKIEASFFVRVILIGRAAILSDRVTSTAEWSRRAGWIAQNRTPILTVDLSPLFRNPDNASELNPKDEYLALRGGAVRFGIDTIENGCAAIAISIWDDTRTIPLDQIVRRINVGSKSACLEAREAKPVKTLYSEGTQEFLPDVSLHIFEFKIKGESRTATFMSLRTPAQDCSFYKWSSDASLIDLLLNNSTFQANLSDARRPSGMYSWIGEQVVKAVFPPNRSTAGCSAVEALGALRKLAREKEVRMFARISDEDDGRLVVLPLGLMAMFEEGGQLAFEHDIRLFQPLARQTMSDTDCVSSWTFVLPSVLYGIPEKLSLPAALNGDPRVLRSRDQFTKEFLDSNTDDEAPSGLLLLAHHSDGMLTFATPVDSLSFNAFDRDLGHGSIAVLSACETLNLSKSTKLVTRLNQKNVDAVVAAAFDLDPVFGTKFAFKFAEVVAEKRNGSITLEEAFSRALAAARTEEAKITTAERARGMGLELVLAGKPGLKICPAEKSSP